MKQNPNYSQTRRQLMNQANELDISATTTSVNQSEFDNARTNIKIDNYLKTISQLESQVAHLQSHIHYCTTVTAWIEAAINHKPVHAHGMKSLMNATAKLNVLEKQAITFNAHKIDLSKSNLKQNNTTTNEIHTKCVVSAHLAYVLNPKQDKQLKIKQLMSARDALYNKIQSTLIKQQPYLHEKIMKKIQKEVKRQTKLQAIKQLQAICKQKQKWLNQAKKQVSEKVDEKIVQQKVTNNLLKMKQIMNKKIINSEYIGSLASNKSGISKNVNRLQRSVDQIKTIVKQQLKKMDDESLESQLSDVQKQKDSKGRVVEINNQFIDVLNDLMSRAYDLLCQPLESAHARQLQQQFERVSMQIQYKGKKNN